MRNNYLIKDDIVIIYLNRRCENKIMECIIDTDKFDLIDSYDVTWCPKWSYEANRFYVGACKYIGLIDGKPQYKMIYLQRILLNCKRFGEWVDHIDHDGMNNRIENLRITTSSENARNREKINANNSTGFRNVSFVSGKYIVQLQVDGKNTVLGRFYTAEEAGLYAEEMREKYYGKFAGNS